MAHLAAGKAKRNMKKMKSSRRLSKIISVASAARKHQRKRNIAASAKA